MYDTRNRTNYNLQVHRLTLNKNWHMSKVFQHYSKTTESYSH